MDIRNIHFIMVIDEYFWLIPRENTKKELYDNELHTMSRLPINDESFPPSAWLARRIRDIAPVAPRATPPIFIFVSGSLR